MNVPPTPANPTEAEIHAYVDDRLDEADHTRVEAWLARHPDRQEEVRAWQRDAQQLRAALGGLPADDRPALDPSVIRGRLRQRRRARLSVAAMLVVALGVGGVGGWQVREMNTPAAAVATAPMADAVQAHRMFAMERQARLDVTRQEVGTLQGWLDRHFPHAVRLPDLQDAGFRAVGGRLIPTESGPAAMVLYVDAQGSTLSFYLRPPASRGGTLPRGGRREGQLATAYWSDNGYNYALVSRAEGAGLRVIRDASGPASI